MEITSGHKQNQQNESVFQNKLSASEGNMQERQKIITEKTAISITVLTLVVSAVSFITAIHARANKHEDDIVRLIASDKFVSEILRQELSAINTKLARIEERLNMESIVKQK